LGADRTDAIERIRSIDKAEERIYVRILLNPFSKSVDSAACVTEKTYG
jgi:hypothetical protein